jgi:hypothetical protein
VSKTVRGSRSIVRGSVPVLVSVAVISNCWVAALGRESERVSDLVALTIFNDADREQRVVTNVMCLIGGDGLKSMRNQRTCEVGAE